MSDRKKVLIIAYYWPPTGGSGVQRWVKFVKYLRKFGWEPILYTPENPESPTIDESLLHDIPSDFTILKTPIWEPYTAYKKFVGLRKSEKLGSALMSTGKEKKIFQSLSIWIRGNFFIPDARRFWINPSVKFLVDYLKNNKVDVIISTGPPHSMHLIAQNLSKKLNLPWLADFRDPWTNIDFFGDLKLTWFAKKIHFYLEKKVLDAATKVLVISKTMKNEFEKITDTSISLITNGFDSSDFPNFEYFPNKKFILSHFGMLTPSRNPMILWQVLRELKDEMEGFENDFQLRLVGNVDNSIQQIISSEKLDDIVTISSYVPHSEVVKMQQHSEALLLVINDSPNASLVLTGKLFEYLASNRPIINITPLHGDASDLLNEVGVGYSVLYSEKNKLKNHIKQLFREWKSNILASYSSNETKQYDRIYLTEQLASELNKIAP